MSKQGIGKNPYRLDELPIMETAAAAEAIALQAARYKAIGISWQLLMPTRRWRIGSAGILLRSPAIAAFGAQKLILRLHAQDEDIELEPDPE